MLLCPLIRINQHPDEAWRASGFLYITEFQQEAQYRTIFRV